MKKFSAVIAIIGINPYVLLPVKLLQTIFKDASKEKSPIPVMGSIDGHPFQQTLVKYSGEWRLYLNTAMRQACGKDVGDKATFTLAYDPAERSTAMHPSLAAALKKDKPAAKLFNELAPYMQKEIMRYINNLKTSSSIDRNVEKAIRFLSGKERFIGRDHP